MMDFRLYDGNTPLMVTPSVSPVFGNNPAFTYLEIDGKEIEDVKVIHFDISKGLEVPKVKVTKLKSFGLKTLNRNSVKEFIQTLKSDPAFFQKWANFRYGLDSDFGYQQMQTLGQTPSRFFC